MQELEAEALVRMPPETVFELLCTRRDLLFPGKKILSSPPRLVQGSTVSVGGFIPFLSSPTDYHVTGYALNKTLGLQTPAGEQAEQYFRYSLVPVTQGAMLYLRIRWRQHPFTKILYDLLELITRPDGKALLRLSLETMAQTMETGKDSDRILGKRVYSGQLTRSDRPVTWLGLFRMLLIVIIIILLCFCFNLPLDGMLNFLFIFLR